MGPSKPTIIKERVEVVDALPCVFIFFNDHMNGVLRWNCFILKCMQRHLLRFHRDTVRTRNTPVNAPLLHAISTQEVTRLNV
jgi:hypothetical protein